jgi:hypothetical protein
MTQRDLNRAVARATGETVDRVVQLGFSLTVVPRPVAWWRRHSRSRRRSRFTGHNPAPMPAGS